MVAKKIKLLTHFSAEPVKIHNEDVTCIKSRYLT
jgi:hypothetical protein